jgi:DNA mismatch repair protein MutS2
MIDDHTLKTLEYPKIITLIDGKCRTPYGHEAVAAIQPRFDRETIEHRLTEVSQMQDIMTFGMAFPLYRMEDCRESLARSQVSGLYLEPSEILHILELVEVSIGLHDYDKEGRDKFTAIDIYLKQIRAFPELKTEIRRIIDENGEVRDNASPKLKQIRLELADSKRKILARLEKVLSEDLNLPGFLVDVISRRWVLYVIYFANIHFLNGSGFVVDLIL